MPVRNTPLSRIFILFCILFFFCSTSKGQGGRKLVLDVGLPLQLEPMADIGMQQKNYWVFDSNLSNSGPGAGCEFNFGSNNSGITIGPKVFYQVDIFMADVGGKRKTGMYLLFRISVIRYTNSHGNDYRVAPEGGVSLSDTFSLMYGYNFIPPFVKEKGLSAVFDNTLSFVLTVGGKKKKSR